MEKCPLFGNTWTYHTKNGIKILCHTIVFSLYKLYPCKNIMFPLQECDVVWSRNTIYLLTYTLQTLFCHIFDIYIWHVLSYHHWNIKTPYFHFIQECDVVWNGNTIYIPIYTTLPILICHIFDIYIYIYIYILDMC